MDDDALGGPEETDAETVQASKRQKVASDPPVPGKILSTKAIRSVLKGELCA